MDSVFGQLVHVLYECFDECGLALFVECITDDLGRDFDRHVGSFASDFDHHAFTCPAQLLLALGEDFLPLSTGVGVEFCDGLPGLASGVGDLAAELLAHRVKLFLQVLAFGCGRGAVFLRLPEVLLDARRPLLHELADGPEGKAPQQIEQQQEADDVHEQDAWFQAEFFE